VYLRADHAGAHTHSLVSFVQMIRTLGTGAIAIAVPRRADYPAAVFGRRRLRGGGSISPVAVTAIAGAIRQEEGYAPGTPAFVNNNPGNLVYAGQTGASQGAGGFASFTSYAAGETALENQILLDATRGTDVNGNPTTTVTQLISSWAPASTGNNTAAYIASVAAQTGYDPDAPLSSLGAPDSGDTSGDSAGLDLSSTVDLSGVGLGAVPLVGLIGACLGLAVLVFGRR
jgi:hypothetical protein